MIKFSIFCFIISISIVTIGIQEIGAQAQKKLPEKSAISKHRLLPEEIIPGKKKVAIENLKIVQLKQKELLQQSIGGKKHHQVNAYAIGNPMSAKVASQGKLKSSKTNTEKSSSMKGSMTRDNRMFGMTRKSPGESSSGNMLHKDLEHNAGKTPFLGSAIKAKLPAGRILKDGSAMQKLDSIVQKGIVSDSVKSVFIYDAKGNSVNEMDYRWSQKQDLTQLFKGEVTYDSIGHQTSYIQSIWDTTMHQWVNLNKYETQYDGNGLVLMYASYYWDGGNSKWVGTERQDHAYDLNGRDTLDFQYNWDYNSDIWIYSTKTQKAFDANGNELLFESYYWDPDSSLWMGTDTKKVSSYDNKNRLIELIGYTANYASWVESFKNEYAYDAHGYNTLSAAYNWDSEMSEWVGGSMDENTYDSAGNLLMYANYNAWNYELSEWIGNTKEVYQYDSVGKLKLYSQFNWNVDSNAWFNYRKSTYNYDINGRATDLSRSDYYLPLLQWVQSFRADYYYNGSNLIWYIQEYSWDSVATQWINYSKREWFYNSYNLESSYATYNWDQEMTEWVGLTQEEHLYDADTNMIRYTYYNGWYPESTDWIPSYKYEHVYNSAKKEIEYAEYDWNYEMYYWRGSYMYDYYYDEKGDKQTAATYSWDGDYNTFRPDNDQKMYQEYNSKGFLVTDAEYSWVSGYGEYWNLDWYYKYSRDNAGRVLSQVNYKWNATRDTLVSFFKKEYNLDTAGRIMDISDFVKDTSNTWTKTYKQVYIYDSKENNTGQFGYLWNAATNTGAIDTKYVLSFDENNFNTLLEYFKWDDIEKAWIENQKSEYVYNGMGKTISQIDYSLMLTNNYHWGINVQNLYEYNAKGNLASAEMKEFDYNKYDHKTDLFYDTDGKLAGTKEYSWNEILHAWIPYYKDEYTYNEEGKEILMLEYEWDTISNSWMNSYKYELSYDENSHFNGWIESQWGDFNPAKSMQWIYSYKNERVCDANGNVLSELDYYWNNNTYQWDINAYDGNRQYSYNEEGKLVFKTTYTYNVGWQEKNLIQITYDDYDKPESELIQNWVDTSEAWYNNAKADFNFDEYGNLTRIIPYSWNGSDWDTTDYYNNYYNLERKFDTSILRNKLYLPWEYKNDYAYDYDELYWSEIDLNDVQYKFNHDLYNTNNKLIEEKFYVTTGPSSEPLTLYYSDFVADQGKLSGTVTHDNQLPVTAGYVKLFSSNSEDAFLMADSTGILANGSYAFSSVPFGNYIILAVADSVQYKRSIPTYLGHTGIWSEATVINLNDSVPNDTLNIEIIILPSLDGKSTLSGQVVETVLKSAGILKSSESVKNQGRPMKGASVVLVGKSNKSGDKIIATTVTDENGMYEFRNVAPGDYEILVDIPGLEMITYHQVTITEAQEAVTNLNYVVGTEGIIIDGIKDFPVTSILIYPNPCRDRINLVLPFWEHSVINIADIQGKIYYQLRPEGPSLSLQHHLAPGIYIITVTDGVQKTYHKMIVQ